MYNELIWNIHCYGTLISIWNVDSNDLLYFSSEQIRWLRLISDGDDGTRIARNSRCHTHKKSTSDFVCSESSNWKLQKLNLFFIIFYKLSLNYFLFLFFMFSPFLLSEISYLIWNKVQINCISMQHKIFMKAFIYKNLFQSKINRNIKE